MVTVRDFLDNHFPDWEPKWSVGASVVSGPSSLDDEEEISVVLYNEMKVGRRAIYIRHTEIFFQDFDTQGDVVHEEQVFYKDLK